MPFRHSASPMKFLPFFTLLRAPRNAPRFSLPVHCLSRLPGSCKSLPVKDMGAIQEACGGNGQLRQSRIRIFFSLCCTCLTRDFLFSMALLMHAKNHGGRSQA